HTDTLTFLFTDIEGSTQLWEREADRMRLALACHDRLARAAVEHCHGTLVKMTGDGMHAVFRNPLDAVGAALDLQLAMADPDATGGTVLRVRCGMHAGVVEHRDNDYFGTPVNRAARIMSAAHGGQIIVSKAVFEFVRDHVPDGVSMRDLGSVRLPGFANSEHVYQVLHPRLRHDFPALRALERTPNNLPQQLTSFIGRGRELAEVTNLLGTARLVTLLGAGGVGKTRLALKVAAELLDDFSDGVWFVELAPLTDPQLVPQAVASAVGVTEEVGRPLAEALAKFVADRHLLLVIDNCEHVVQACAELTARLLQSGSMLRILASSREPFRTAAESTYPVPALAVPDPTEKIALDAMTRYESVELFVDRAVAQLPAFRLSEGNARAVIEICRHLDGIPLAIELAAARVRALSVDNIAARLNDRFRLLTSGNRTALPRQQTLRALIDWSHDLLSAMECVVFRRLAVFAGGWTLEAAEAIAYSDGIERSDVLDPLTQLVEKSLVVADVDTGRYRLLETVRDYARGRLADAGEAAATEDRHLTFYLALAERARSEFFGAQQVSWLARLDDERENLLAAHACCVRDQTRGHAGLQLVTAMKQYLHRRGFLSLADRLMSESLAHPAAQVREVERSRALFSLGQIRNSMGHYVDARACLEESVAIGREIGSRQRVAAALQPLAITLAGLGDFPGARRCYDEAIELARQIGVKREIASALNNRAQLHRLEDELELAMPLLEQALSLIREVSDTENTAVMLLNLAMIDIASRSCDTARDALREALAIAVDTGSKPASQSVIEVAVGLAAECREWSRAARLFGAAESLAAETQFQRDTADEAFLAPLIAKARGNLAPSQFDAAEAAGRQLTLDGALAEVQAWLQTDALRIEQDGPR
ncbi:MAG: tetratricopeptide repeat protein, partial [Betaproteobacteria bacterium]